MDCLLHGNYGEWLYYICVMRNPATEFQHAPLGRSERLLGSITPPTFARELPLRRMILLIDDLFELSYLDGWSKQGRLQFGRSLKSSTMPRYVQNLRGRSEDPHSYTLLCLWPDVGSVRLGAHSLTHNSSLGMALAGLLL